MKPGYRGTTKDYSDAFLVAILIGIVVIVLSLMMAIAHSTSRYPEISGAIAKDAGQPNAFLGRDQQPDVQR
jgi:hypothetical protein